MTIIQTLRAEISERQAKITAIQNACSHPLDAVTLTLGSNTGNWCPSDDCYWTDYNCSLCEKSWRVEHVK